MVSITRLLNFLTYVLSCVIRNVGSYSIHRTAENKPYVKFDKSINTNWNYNVSHHGKYVAIASHAHCSIGTHFFLSAVPYHSYSLIHIGIDIVDITTRSNICHSSSEYINMFAKQLHPSELARTLYHH